MTIDNAAAIANGNARVAGQHARTAADAARRVEAAQASTSRKIDQMLNGVKRITRGIDNLEGRMDTVEAEGSVIFANIERQRAIDEARREYRRLERRADEAADRGHPRKLGRYHRDMRTLEKYFGNACTPRSRSDSRTNIVASVDPPLVEIIRKNELGRTEHTFTGDPLAWMSQFMTTAQCVTGFPVVAGMTRDSSGKFQSKFK